MTDMAARLQRLERGAPQREPPINRVLIFLGDSGYLAEYHAEITEYVDSVLSSTPQQPHPLMLEIRKGEAGGVTITGGGMGIPHQIPAHSGSRQSESLEGEVSLLDRPFHR